jgi:hypothetical protein
LDGRLGKIVVQIGDGGRAGKLRAFREAADRFR